ncbi:MAG: MBOAT family protein [Verrucomicrobia bacterium]|nr:MBOAT family protein [Verrucomicrobiota bacterium]
MIFCSYEFLFLFLPLVLLGYYFVFARVGRTAFLTLMSYLFYGWWDYRFCGLLLLSTVLDHWVGRFIVGAKTRAGARRWLIVSVVANLSVLGFFKYFDLGASTANYLASLLGADAPLVPLLHLVLPVGISFYTFQTMSYAIDLYQGRAKLARDWWSFACYVALFPQLVAGPIVRYHELAEQLVERRHSLAKFTNGTALFILGLAKKVLLADGVAPLVPLAFDVHQPGLLDGWVGTLAYAMQIYFDFSGYSDMAVGLGLMFGFRFPINFDSPYKSVSITDFWRRWHISLSSWLRDYLYIPLGGNRIGSRRTYVNLFLVMLLGGLWHGANWTFVAWGAFHGLLLAWERLRRNRSAAPSAFSRPWTFILVCFAWVLFRAPTLPAALNVWKALIGLEGLGNLAAYGGALQLNVALAILVAVCFLSWFAPNSWSLLRPDNDDPPSPFGVAWSSVLLRTAMYAALALLCIGAILINTSSPFLYFQF